jgi:kynurenine formamidase
MRRRRLGAQGSASGGLATRRGEICGLALAALLLGCQTPAGTWLEGEVVDLTHAFDAGTIYWPTDREGFVLEELAAGMTEKGYYYAANRFRSAEHGGTHIDAPVHFAEGRAAVDAIPVEQLLGPGVVVDVSAVAAADPDYEVSVSDFAVWEARHGELPAGSIVLLRTGFGRHWGERARYLGTERTGPEAVAELHFPGLHPDAARWLVERRAIGAIGLDTPSIDRGQSTLFESHRILFEREIPALENLARLEALPETGFFVIALPMKIRGGSGGPLRAIAILPR